VETRTESLKSIAEIRQIDYKLLYHTYRKVSKFEQWQARDHASEYLVFPQNMGPRLSFDEVSVSRGELYSILTNKEARGRKGTLVAMVNTTKADDIIMHFSRLPRKEREIVQEVTLDLAENMANAVKELFPNARIVADRFHVEKLGHEVVQGLRVKLRWQAIKKENEAFNQAKDAGLHYKPKEFYNGDTEKQLLARSRYALFKSEAKWTSNQRMRMEILFAEYPQLKQAHDHVMALNLIYSKKINRDRAIKELKQWIRASRKQGITGFKRLANTVKNHFELIVNYFKNRSTNASAESFNAKVKQFRALQRGVSDTSFFLFRLSKLYA
jgi:transposase